MAEVNSTARGIRWRTLFPERRKAGNIRTRWVQSRAFEKAGGKDLAALLTRPEWLALRAEANAEYDVQHTPVALTEWDRTPLYNYSGPRPSVVHHARGMVENPADAAAKREELVRAALEEHFVDHDIIDNTSESGFDFHVELGGVLMAEVDAKSSPVITEAQREHAHRLIGQGVQVWLFNPGHWKKQITLTTELKPASWRVL